MLFEKCEYGCDGEASFSFGNKKCCSDNVSKCPGIKAKIALKRAGKKSSMKKVTCKFCNDQFGNNVILRHTNKCFLNPVNIRLCPVCEEPIKDIDSVTCSKSCSNRIFKSGIENPAFSGNIYQTTCYYYNKKCCIVCGESNVLDVHHLDNNHNNNKFDNLVPLCPTHHRYMHSNFKDLISSEINNWRKEISKTFKLFEGLSSVEIFEWKKNKW